MSSASDWLGEVLRGGRLAASLVWALAIVIKPVRELLVTLAVTVWPSKIWSEGFLRFAPVRWIYFGALLMIGYVATAYVAGRTTAYLSRQAEGQVDWLRPHGGDHLTIFGILVTVGWLVICLTLGLLSPELLLVGALVVFGLAGQKRATPLPVPDIEPFPLPSPIHPLPEPVDEDSFAEDGESGGLFLRLYEWLFKRKPYLRRGEAIPLSLRLGISKETYTDLRGRSHDAHQDGDFVRFAEEEVQDAVVDKLASRIRQLVRDNGLDRLGEIHLAMAFTLSLTYASDDEFGGEYPRYPVESLVDKKGDCEDHAILCGAVLKTLGHRVALVLMDTGPDSGHAALAVEAPQPVEGVSFPDPDTGKPLFYCEVTPGVKTTKETTAVQWWLGMAPPAEASGFRLALIRDRG